MSFLSILSRRVYCSRCFSLVSWNVTSYSFLPKEQRQIRHIFITSNILVNNKRRRKEREIIVMKKKSTKPTVQIYNDSTELALALGQSLDSVSEVLLNLNEKNIRFLDDINSPLDKKLIMDIVVSYDFKPSFNPRPGEKIEKITEDIKLQPPAPEKELKKRAPVVTIMGHVDHGKTTLLDSLRNSRIVDQEYGGITQTIGAFSVTLPLTKQMVTFLDTPGHAAFKAMRERGAKATDIVVLVVAADDGVKDQTIESIKYAQNANVPIVVAINKCDKPTADSKRVKYELLQYNLVSDDMEVSTVIVGRGTLKKNSYLVAGCAWAKVRSLQNDLHQSIQEAGPSFPVRIAGWRDELPLPGDIVLEVESEQEAQDVVNYRRSLKSEEKFLEEKEVIDKQRELARQKYVENRATLFQRGIRYGSSLRNVEHKLTAFRKERDYDKEGKTPRVGIVLRCDMEGSLEAILNVFESYKESQQEQVEFDLVDFGIGPPNDRCLEMAESFNASIYCFNVAAQPAILEQAILKNIHVENFNVIYKLIETLKKQLSEKLKPNVELKLIGNGHVLKQFKVLDGSRRIPVAGVYVESGIFEKTKVFRFIRNGEIIYEGHVESLKKGSEYVDNATKNTEVGICVKNKEIRFKTDDDVEVYEEIITPRVIDWYPPGF